uniref:Antioxidant, AhpC/TSA family n=1 Tax=Babesia bovis TaxID=5865 RepID=S6CAG8_BABBO|nr:antioxidant, AhpC/TSA family [Babesia bovis]
MMNGVLRLSTASAYRAMRMLSKKTTGWLNNDIICCFRPVYNQFVVRAFGTQAGSYHTNIGDLVGREFPDFKTSAVINGNITEFDASAYFRDSYALLVFYPLDFTFVCPSELLGFSARLSEFEQRGIKVVGISIDSVFSHLAWLQMDLKKGGVHGLKIPLVSDISRSISKSFGLLRSDGFAQRASVLIDKTGKVRHTAVFDLGIGRSVDETLRVFDAIKFNDESGQVCPVNWQKGGAGMSQTSSSTGDYLFKTFS